MLEIWSLCILDHIGSWTRQVSKPQSQPPVLVIGPRSVTATFAVAVVAVESQTEYAKTEP